jgi:pilus assembly protein FimV
LPDSGDDADLNLSSTQEIPDFSADLNSGLTNDLDFVADDTAEQPTISENDSATALVDDDATLEILQEATMTEVGTKLDLARAYIDMGDPDGARSILNEVLAEGSEAQSQEAQQLLGDLQD